MEGLREFCSEGEEAGWLTTCTPVQRPQGGLRRAAGRAWLAVVQGAVNVYRAYLATAYRPLGSPK